MHERPRSAAARGAFAQPDMGERGATRGASGGGASAWRRWLRRGAGVTLAAALAACNALTGASEYAKTVRCTGPLCGRCEANEFVDPVSGYCAACPGGAKGCGSSCCGAGRLCGDASQSLCAPCAVDETACGGACCGAGQVCRDSSAGQCAQDCGARLRCGGACCGEGERCDEASGRCREDCTASNRTNCGPICCGSSQVCIDAATGTCGCDPSTGAAGAVVCEDTCCGGGAPYCIEELGTKRCGRCTDVSLECGDFCCLVGQSCLDSVTGACGVLSGQPGRSCGVGLDCDAPSLGGAMTKVSCCESLVVKGATFVMGLDGDAAKGGAKSDGASYLAEVSTYALDRFEVTVGRFKAFVEGYDDFVMGGMLPEGAGVNTKVSLAPPGTGWRAEWNARLPASKTDLLAWLADHSTTYSPDSIENDAMPINGVTWYQAFAFCAWDGGRLPTEAEWELAASNGEKENVYPWGDTSPGADVMAWCTGAMTCLQTPKTVGLLPALDNDLGHRDLSGNVWEWVLDGFDDYPVVAPKGSNEPNGAIAKDYANPQVMSQRGIRGGSFGSEPASDALQLPPSEYRAAHRAYFSPALGVIGIGVRCARNVP